ncbi:MAG: alpha/beta fold hydrolase [Deinococcus-Thermus bacterium]|jgi:putative redox protein|nr:alpha/beta fold hydrolase [Deinococcota bacterium]
MATRHVDLDNRRGRRLAARLDLPDVGPPAATALLAHCFTCGKDLKGLVRLSRTLTEHGFAVLRVDFAGLGESEGELGEAGLGGDADDLEDAAAWLEDEVAAPSLLVGHSLGGLAALLAAVRLPSLRAVATIGTPAEPEHVTGLLAGDPEELAEGEEMEVTVAGRDFRLPKRFFDELRERSPAQCLGELRAPVLILHSVTDEVVGVDHAERLFRAARREKSFVSLGQAGHLLPRERDARYAGRMIGAWAAAHLEAEGEADGVRPVVPAGTGRLADRINRAVTEEGYATDAWAGGHPLRLDEPTDHGGTDTGPNPVETLRVALAACTTITLRMYADRKGWPLKRITCDVDGSSKRQGGTMRTHLTRRIGLIGDLDEEQRERLIEIAGRCPVHRTLEGEVTIDTEEAPAEAG